MASNLSRSKSAIQECPDARLVPERGEVCAFARRHRGSCRVAARSGLRNLCLLPVSKCSDPLGVCRMTARPLGLSNQEIRPRKLQALGDPLLALNTIVLWAMFRPMLESIHVAGRDPHKDGYPPHDQWKSPRDDPISLEPQRPAARSRASACSDGHAVFVAATDAL